MCERTELQLTCSRWPLSSHEVWPTCKAVYREHPCIGSCCFVLFSFLFFLHFYIIFSCNIRRKSTLDVVCKLQHDDVTTLPSPVEPEEIIDAQFYCLEYFYYKSHSCPYITLSKASWRKYRGKKQKHWRHLFVHVLCRSVTWLVLSKMVSMS